LLLAKHRSDEDVVCEACLEQSNNLLSCSLFFLYIPCTIRWCRRIVRFCDSCPDWHSSTRRYSCTLSRSHGILLNIGTSTTPGQWRKKKIKSIYESIYTSVSSVVVITNSAKYIELFLCRNRFLSHFK
jgi:hypothetical protein